MSGVMAWIAAEAEGSSLPSPVESVTRAGHGDEEARREVPVRDLPVHQFPAKGNPHPSTISGQAVSQKARDMGHPARDVRPPVISPPSVGEIARTAPARPDNEDFQDREQERRTYRGRAVAMLRRYMRYSMETGRLPSVLGREFFRAKVTSYTVATFEDRVIFVHDMETCLERLDEFSQQLIARHILQEHDRWSTARLLHCNEKTVRRLTPLVLDRLSEILLDMGLMERVDTAETNCCQGGPATESRASDWEESK
jgi:hypothetical protein